MRKSGSRIKCDVDRILSTHSQNSAGMANVNNFNVIYLLSGGDPVTNLASTAGDTDLLVTWLYKLTIEKQYYNIGAVVGILTFIILAAGSLLTYRNSKSYKEEGGF